VRPPAPLLLALMLALAVASLPGARGEPIVAATMLPAPVGFIYVLDRPVGDVVGVYVGGTYEEYKARVGATSKLFHLKEVDSVLTRGGAYQLMVIRPNTTFTVLGVNLPGKDDLVLLTENGYVFTSQYRILYQHQIPEGVGAGGNAVVIGDKVDLRPEGRVVYIVPVTWPGARVTVITGERAETVSIAKLVGVQEECIVYTRPSSTFPWYGGLLPTPVCAEGINGVVRDVYNEQPLYTVFSKSVGRHVVYVAFSDVTASLLVRLGFLTPVDASPSVHVIPATLDNVHLYFSRSMGWLPVMVKVVNSTDATVVLDREGGERVCVLPADSEVVLHIGWGQLPARAQQVKLAPGEVLLYRVKGSGAMYACRGDLSFLDAPAPSLSKPSIKQLREPVGVSSGAPVVLVLGNGKLYYGTRFTIPYDDYDGNALWVIYRRPYMVDVEPPSLWGMPVFWLSLLLVALFVAVVIQRPKAPPRKIQIIWDIATPPPLELADRALIARKVSQFLDIFGVCPDDVELAMMGALLPAQGEKPADEVIVCNFKTNVETEKVLRRVVRVANDGFWAFKRRGRNYGFLYTRIGDSLLVFYLYKQEDEKEVAELLLNAIEAAMHTYIGIPLYTRHQGIIIVAEPGMAKAAREEYVKMGVVDEEWRTKDEKGRLRNISGYLSLKFPNLSSEFVDKLAGFVEERVPLIVVASEDERVVIDVLGEVASTHYEEYLRKRGVKGAGEQ